MQNFTEKKLLRNNLKINYIEGPDNAQPLILIPGQGGTWESYKQVLVPLSKSYKVYAVDVRGHGGSSWTTGDYSFKVIGEDFTAFIKEVVKKPAFISGNSSGGLIALWLAANQPDLVKGIVLEDAPLFSADWPRIKTEFVYEVLDKTARYLGAEGGPDYEGMFKSIQKPKKDGKVTELPGWIVKIFVWLINRYKKTGEPLDIPVLPSRIRLAFKSFSAFDPDFSRSWVDGRIYEGLNHVDALSRVRCPLVIIHADWYRTEKGLVGAMDDDDAKHALELAPHAEYVRLNSRHVTHSGASESFVKIVNEFIEKHL